MIKDYWIKFKRFILPYPMAYFVKYALRMLLWTCRIQCNGLESFNAFAKDNRCILSLWHNKLAILPEVLNRFTSGLCFTAVVSKSRDGEPLALAIESYKKGRTIRVAHNDKHGALRSLIDHLKASKDVIVITPDGPRGPRYVLKPGVIAAAKASGASIVPFSWSADCFWEMNTWDRFMLPKPFSTIQVTFGVPIICETDNTLEHELENLQAYMLKQDSHS